MYQITEEKIGLAALKRQKIHPGAHEVNWILVKSNQMEPKRNESAKASVKALLNMGM